MPVNLLNELVNILPGHPFRGAVPHISDGDVSVIQMRDVSPNGEIQWDGMLRTTLKGRKTPGWIKEGDILLVARGLRFFAVYMTDIQERCVPANQFIHMRVKPECFSQLIPGYLVWLLNQAPIQQQLNTLATGTHVPNLSKSALSTLPIPYPESLERQQLLVTLGQQVDAETRAYEQLMDNRKEMLATLAYQVMEEEGVAQ